MIGYRNYSFIKDAKDNDDNRSHQVGKCGEGKSGHYFIITLDKLHGVVHLQNNGQLVNKYL